MVSSITTRGSSASCSVCRSKLLSMREAAPSNTEMAGGWVSRAAQTASMAWRVQSPTKTESHRLILRQRHEVGQVVEIGQRERRNGKLVLSREVQHRATGDQQLEV